jgi:septum formation protein
MTFKQTNKPLVLASGSPRRKELLTTLGLPFHVFVSDVDESFPENLAPHLVPGLLSERKAAAVLKEKPYSLILASDTVVVLGDEILNKPVDDAEARKMLLALSGKTHFVYTAFTLKHAHGSLTFTDRADVTFKTLSNLEIDHYINNGKPFDKAGAYGIQEWIGLIAVERIEGSYFTVMGLPTHLVWQELLKGGFIS